MNWEYKLVFKDDRLAEPTFQMLSRLQTLAGLKCTQEAVETHEEACFDTPDLALDALGLVCFVRNHEGSDKYLLIVEPGCPGCNGNDIHLHKVFCTLDADAYARMTDGRSPQCLRNILEGAVDLRNIRKTLHRRVSCIPLLLANDAGATARLHLDRIETFLPGQDEPRTVDYEIGLRSEMERFPEAAILQDTLRNTLGLIPVRRSRTRGLATPTRCRKASLEKQKVILDMDTGVDDALAIILAMRSPELQVLGITASSGNIDARQAHRNTKAVLGFLGRELALPPSSLPPTAAGLTATREIPHAAHVHGSDGLGGVTMSDEILQIIGDPAPSSEDAYTLFKRLVQEHEPKTITLIVTGPLTNVAHWIESDPDAVQRLKEIVVMGGVFFECGNRSPVAESNMYSDPESAGKVVAFCRRPVLLYPHVWRETLPLTFVGLDVTHRVTLRRDTLDRLSAERPGDRMIRFIKQFTADYMNFCYRNKGLEGCYLHDPLAVGYVIDPSFCRVERYHVEVEDRGRVARGMTIADVRSTRIFKERSKEVTWVCVKVDASRFENFFTERVLGPS
ncbi:nucleoside hydrolase [Desulfoglaeba alkanexedens]|uniref:Nucleoside hydrolase n=1 Tax=Desulfoglaeba alkanexedens ALDC TaxID=980445 RepID=A0A4P8KZV7_9BACT|nr:nucleoside hydrolase [Desulfoglaeba alkanexedens]QCQ21107.1 nucleoside hydrolase [Desulfoglaeba alkanexedens ALDC]